MGFDVLFSGVAEPHAARVADAMNPMWKSKPHCATCIEALKKSSSL